jgi:hypothetical protein
MKTIPAAKIRPGQLIRTAFYLPFVRVTEVVLGPFAIGVRYLWPDDFDGQVRESFALLSLRATVEVAP